MNARQNEERRSPRKDVDRERRLRSAVGDVLEGHGIIAAAAQRKVSPQLLSKAVAEARKVKP